MVFDYRAAEILIKKYPNKFKVLRYEDLSFDPLKQTEELLKFYGLPFDVHVQQFLQSHTNADIGVNKKISTTLRDSKAAPHHWMHELRFDEIKQIESVCTEAMSMWGYKTVDSQDELQNSFNPLLIFPFLMKSESNQTSDT